MQPNKDVTVIIVAYKSVHIIHNALKSIVGKGYRIIVVDNGSNDNIEQFFKDNYANSGIELVLLGNNHGFSKGNNHALRKVKTKYALLLNPDAIMDEESIDNLAIEADKDQNIAMANPIFFHKSNLTKSEMEGVAENLSFPAGSNVIYRTFMCGGASLMKMEVFHKIGFLDENIFLYGEDDEISNRVAQKGYKGVVVKNSYCFHANQSSVKIENKLDKYRMQYFRHWHQGWGKTYIKVNVKSKFRIWLKAFHRVFLSLFYLIKFDVDKAIIRFSLSVGTIAFLTGFDCFNKDNKIVTVKKNIIL